MGRIDGRLVGDGVDERLGDWVGAYACVHRQPTFHWRVGMQHDATELSWNDVARQQCDPETRQAEVQRRWGLLGPYRDMRLETSLVACRIENVRQATGWRVVHPELVGEITDPDQWRDAGEHGPGGRRDHELLSTNLSRRARPALRCRPDGDVSLPCFHRRNEVVAATELDQAHLNVRVLGAPDSQCSRKYSDADRKQGADVQLTGVDPGGSQRRSPSPLGMSQTRSGMRKRGAPGGGQPHASAQAFEKRAAKLAFQGLDLMREARLAYVQPRRRCREGAVVDHRDEVLQLAKRHCHARNLSYRDYLSIRHMGRDPSLS